MPTTQDLQVWIVGTPAPAPAKVWLPDPIIVPEVYVPGFWGILMQNNPDTP